MSIINKPTAFSTGIILEPVSADPPNPVEGQQQYSDGTHRLKGVWEYNGTTWQNALTSLGYETKSIGEPFAIMGNLTGVLEPDNGGDKKFIKLTAGLTGVGQYNEGFLASETISGISPNVEAVATIDLVGSPIYGQVIHLINTEGAFLRAGETSGTFETYKTGRPQDTAFTTNTDTHSHIQGVYVENIAGTLKNGTGTSGGSNKNAGVSGGSGVTGVTNTDAHSHSITGGGDTETAPKNVTVTYYMRIL